MTGLRVIELVIATVPGAFAQHDSAATEPGAALSDAEVQQQVNAYLGSIDTPVTPDRWRALGPRAIPLLESVVRNGKELPTRRAKAIAGLAALNAPRAASLFAALAAKEEEPLTTRLAAVRGLAQVTPARRVPSTLRPLLEEAKDSRVRAVAAEQLALRTKGKSCDLVRAQVERESAETKAHFRKALARCENRG